MSALVLIQIGPRHIRSGEKSGSAADTVGSPHSSAYRSGSSIASRSAVRASSGSPSTRSGMSPTTVSLAMRASSPAPGPRAMKRRSAGSHSRSMRSAVVRSARARCGATG